MVVGEVIHGDYSQWANPEMLDAVTNYECFKGLYSSFNDHNLFEIAYSLNRQFGDGGVYRDLRLYNFADNHDVDRVASLLDDPAHLAPLYTLLFAMPGVPSVYYGSEWGMIGEKREGNDAPLRPELSWPVAPGSMPHPELEGVIRTLAHIRQETPALRHGDYEQCAIASEQLAFQRRSEGSVAVVVVNASHEPIPMRIPVTGMDGTELADALDPSVRVIVANGVIDLPGVPAHGACILTSQEP